MKVLEPSLEVLLLIQGYFAEPPTKPSSNPLLHARWNNPPVGLQDRPQLFSDSSMKSIHIEGRRVSMLIPEDIGAGQ